MKFKSLFFSLCLLFIGTAVFAGTPANALNGEEPLTVKSANKHCYEALTKLPLNASAALVATTSIRPDDGDCTVTMQVDFIGSGGTVSATAPTCREALQRILDFLY